jgi:hypothetical protein
MLAYDPPLVANGTTLLSPLTNANALYQNNTMAFAGATGPGIDTSSGGEMNQLNHALFADFAAALAPDPGPSSSDAFSGASTNPRPSSGDPAASVTTTPDLGPSNGGTAAAVVTMPDPGPSSSNAFSGATTNPGPSSGDLVQGVIMHDPGPASGNSVPGVIMHDPGPSSDNSVPGVIMHDPGPSSDTVTGITVPDPASTVPSTWQQSLTLLGNYMASTFTPPAFGDSVSSGPDVLPLPPPGSLTTQPLMDHHNSA